MKIALIRKKYTPFGGAERYVDSLVKHLLKLGHEVHIFAHQWQAATPPGRSPLRAGGRKPQPLRGVGLSGPEAATGKLFFHMVPMIKGLSVLKVLSFAINARRLLKRERFDVIHSFERTLYQDIYRAGDGCHREWLIQRAKHEPSWKTILVRMNPLHHAFLWIERRLFDPKNTRIIIANSVRGKEEIVRHYNFPEDRIRVVYNGVDTDRFNPFDREKYRATARQTLGLLPSDRVILFLGSGFERKGLSFALRTVAALDDAGIRLVVAGKDNPRRYRKLAAQLGIRNRVIFIGPTKEPEKLYAAADVFLLPTIYDPFSNACLEALTSGIPVVTTRINGASELVMEAVNGYIIDQPDGVESWRNKLLEGLRLDFGRSLSGDIYSLTWEKQIEEVISIYEQHSTGRTI